ncbi:hypothetical protein CsSME_00045892 [Camellia sinensis var. sinensis]
MLHGLGYRCPMCGCYFEELYNYYTTEKVSFEALIGYNYFGVIECIFSPRGIKSEAWHLCDPDAEKVFKTLRNAGVKLAVVSNFDTRLRPFDAVAVSAEVAAEKPNPTIFIKACELLGVKPEDAVHVGDDRRNDIWSARDAGCDAWPWGSDVHSFKEVSLTTSLLLLASKLHEPHAFLLSSEFNLLLLHLCYIGLDSFE